VRAQRPHFIRQPQRARALRAVPDAQACGFAVKPLQACRPLADARLRWTSACVRLAAVGFLAAVAATICGTARADPRTVCTITVNSPDEKEAMRRHLPAGQYRFVELVERGRPDWLESACQSKVQCDVLVVSGHFNGHDFFSDQLSAQEYLPVAEMERVACSNACPNLFSHLKEVYLFGCTSLSPELAYNRGAEIERRLVRAGQPRAEAGRVARMLSDRYEESNRDFMRRVFRNVPAIYGFSNVAPLGPTSGYLLDRYFQGGAGNMFTGRPNGRLLATFSAHNMAMASGLTDADPHARYRAEACRFVDDRTTPAQKLRFVHAILDRDAPEARMFLERIEGFLATLKDADRQDAAFVSVRDEIAADTAARDRYLDYARGVDPAGVRARMLAVAHSIGWLDEEAYHGEQVRLAADLMSGPVMSTADLDAVCAQNAHGELDARVAALTPAPFTGDRIDRAAALACLGSAPDRARMLVALASPDETDQSMAEVYFKHRPITDQADLREAAAGIAAMNSAPDAQAHALDTLSRMRIADAGVLADLTRLFEVAPSLKVQRAIAGILIRADYTAIATPGMVSMLQERRIKSHDGEDLIDILIRRVHAIAVTLPRRYGATSAGTGG
jgi:hypothetical protein